MGFPENTHSNGQQSPNETSVAAHPHAALTTGCYGPPDVPDVAAVSTLLHHFPEEGACDVGVCFIVVKVLLTELDIMTGPCLQTVQSVRKEDSAYLQEAM